MNTTTFCHEAQARPNNKNPLRVFLNWLLRQRIVGAEEMSKTK